MTHRFWFILAVALGLVLPFALNTSLAETVRPVLDVDGGYVELPPHIFDNLDAATVELWVKFRSLALSGPVRFGG